MNRPDLAPHEATLVVRLRDRRGGRVVFLSHCLLNANTRYLGGAGHAGAVPEIVRQCLDAGVGMVQMPCPEQEVWGGVLKRRLLWFYGLRGRNPIAYRLRRLLLPLLRAYTRVRYRALARQVARRIADYQDAGVAVAGIVGVDGSPSCGVGRTIAPACIDALCALDVGAITPARHTALLRRYVRPGRGVFIDEVQRALRRRRSAPPFIAHDLFTELDGAPSAVRLDDLTASGTVSRHGQA